jgi:hypothetical protein
MKQKITLSIIVILSCALAGIAQTNVQKQEVAAPFERVSSQSPSAERGQTSEWYNYGQAIYDLGGNVSYFRNFLFPDSTVQVEFSTGMGSVWKHSLGQVLDPTSTLFFNNTPLLATDDYSLDSVRFWYRYFRFQTAAPDTVVIQIYKHNRHTFNTFSTSGAPYAYVNYNYNMRKGATPDLEVTVLLTDADTAMDAQRTIEIPVNIIVNPDEKISATITYFPGNPFNVGDTIDTYMTSPPVNQINAFVAYDFRDNDKTIDAGEYNNQLNASSDVRYNISTNNWNGKYIPGTAWNAGFYHLDMDFKVTSNPVSVNEIEGSDFTVVLYPNPAANSLTVRSSTLKIERVEIIDVIGKTIFSQQSSGSNRQTIDVSALTEGIYFVKVTGNDGQTGTSRFAISR